MNIIRKTPIYGWALTSSGRLILTDHSYLDLNCEEIAQTYTQISWRYVDLGELITESGMKSRQIQLSNYEFKLIFNDPINRDFSMERDFERSALVYVVNDVLYITISNEYEVVPTVLNFDEPYEKMY